MPTSLPPTPPQAVLTPTPAREMPPSPATDPLRGRWAVAALLGAGVLVNYLDRVNLTVSHDALLHDFGISNITFGYLASAYSWTYAASQLPVGVLLDRFGVRLTGLVSTGIWALASFAGAVSPTLGGLFGSRLLLGVGEGPTFPANAKAVGLWFSDAEKGTATALFDSAAKFASAIGVPLLGLLLLRSGWRWSFAVTGLLSLGYLGAFAFVYRDPTLRRAQSPMGDRKPAHKEALPFGILLRNRKVLGLSLGMGAYNYVFYLLVAWLPSYLSFSLHLNLVHSFLYTGVPWLVATVTGLGTGIASDALIRRGADASRVRQTVLVTGMACGLGIFGAAHAHTAASALLWISFSLGGLAAAAPIAWAVPSMISPRDSVGSVGGIMNFASQLSGIVAPILTGYLVQYTHSYGWAFGISGIYLILGLLAYIFLLGRLDRIGVDAPSATA